jgi:hypothetical protein
MARGTGKPPSRADDGRAADEERSLGQILHRLSHADEDGKISVNDALAAFEDRSSGVLVTMLGLIAALPFIGAVPGISITTALLILGVIGHAAFGGRGIRVPGRLGRLSVAKEKFDAGLDASSGVVRRVDSLLRQRLVALTSTPPARMAILAAVALLALTMFPLAFVPWGVTAPSLGIIAFGLALIARDGAFAIAGYAFVGATILLGVWLA